ncbi:Hypothetical predicted protein [Marmota monax]|uniref:Uncharacterized protein n=1 Tax=Marmota monax TaxID=9995 RepID=A0A5E4A0D9_MARMO|nr:Hypothetical predicted protein [Marmota monax]
MFNPQVIPPYQHSLHFTLEDTEAQRDKEVCSGAHSAAGVKDSVPAWAHSALCPAPVLKKHHSRAPWIHLSQAARALFWTLERSVLGPRQEKSPSVQDPAQDSQHTSLPACIREIVTRNLSQPESPD